MSRHERWLYFARLWGSIAVSAAMVTVGVLMNTDWWPW